MSATMTERAPLARIDCDLGVLSAGLVQNLESEPTAGIRLSSGYTLPETFTRYLDLAATGTDPFLKHEKMSLNADGTAEFGGTLSAADGEFTGSLSIGGIRYGPLHMDTSDRETGSSTSEVTLETIAIPAGAMGTGGGIRLTAHFNFDGATGAKLVRLKLDGTTLLTFSFNASGFEGRAYMDALIVNTGADDAQRSHGTLLLESTGGVQIQTDTSAVDTSGAVNLTITAQTQISSDEITLETSLAELIAPGA